MISRLNLTWRGMLLVAFPLACQLTFLVVLGSLLSSMHADLTAENNARRLISEIGNLLDSCTEFYAMPTAHPGSDPVSVRAQEDNMQEVLSFQRRYNRIIDELAPSAAEKTVVDQLQQQWRALISLTAWGNQQQRLGSLHWQGGAKSIFSRGEHAIGMRMITGLQNLSDLENQRRLSGPAHSKGFYGSVAVSIAAAIIASLALAIGLGFWYAIGIKQPVLRIAENSRLLSYHQALLPELEGIDELSSLDHLLHTVSQQMEQVLQREMSLIENAGDMICSLSENGHFKVVNPAAQKLLGYNAEEIIGKELHDLVPAEDGLLCDEHVRKACASTETQEFELRLTRPDGTVIDTSWTCFWSGIEKSLFCVAHDITERKRIDSLKQDFIDMISHDLRSPLTSMFGSMSLITSGAAGEVSREILEEAARAARNIEVLINFVNDLLDFQKLESGRIQLESHDADLNQTIEEAAQMLADFADSRHVTLSLPEGRWIVYCDRQKIVQTLVNLLSNAIKFSPAGSTVSIEAIDDNQEFFEINVIDSGPGVPIEYRERIFEAFEQVPTLSRRAGGTGLGLAICKLIVTAHGGSLGVSDGRQTDDGESKGSRFWLRLPRHTAGASIREGQ